MRSRHAPKLVAAAKSSEQIRELRALYTQALKGRRCVVIGSAPSAARVELRDDDAVFCVNGSGWIADKWNYPSPDLTVIGAGSLKTTTEVTRATIESLAGKQTKGLLLVADEAELSSACHILSEIGYQFDSMNAINKIQRAAIFDLAWSTSLPVGPKVRARDRPSNGLFAASIAILAGVSELIMTGFSLSQGHAYMSGATERRHIDSDLELLRRAGLLGLKVETTSAELAKTANIMHHQVSPASG